MGMQSCGSVGGATGSRCVRTITHSFIPDDVLRDTALLMSDWRRLQDALILASFWALDMRDDRIGFDGARWIIEGRRKDIYRFVHRWSPNDETI
jgi:hypothetical protein